jgi:cyclophilin family peptidyl-prolyl cis-trans isomerase
MTRPRFVPGVVLSILALGGAVVLAGALPAGQKAKPAPVAAPVLVLDTVKGIIEIEMHPADAPRSVERIVALARKGFYRGQRFHWATTGVIQFGDPQSRDMTKEATWGMGGSGPRGSVHPIGVAEVFKRQFVRGWSARLTARPEGRDATAGVHPDWPQPEFGGQTRLGYVTKGTAVADKIEKSTRSSVTVKDFY